VGLVSSKEPDAERAREVARSGTILRTLVGSTAHGLSNPGTDDRDEMAVCVEPPEYLLGLRTFEHYVERTQPEGSPSGPGDLDLVVYGLRKYCRLALKGSPTTLLLLFARDDLVLERTSLGEELQSHAPAVVSRRTGLAFLGYLDAQRRSLLGERHAPRNRELSQRHGYDTKYAMHALRIAIQGQELLRERTITLPVAAPHRERLMEVRRGELPLDSVLAMLASETEALEALTSDPRLPEEPDHERFDRFLVRAYRESWA
jgi:predicted nucleotidyltransferase